MEEGGGFVALLNAIQDSDRSNEEEVAALNTRIRDELSANPTLANKLDDKRSTLHAALEADLDKSIIKMLIEANPLALLYTSLADPAPLVRPWPYEKNIIHEIAAHRSLFELMPRIANNFPSILDDKACLERPPIFDLIRLGTRAVVREFLEAHPQSHHLIDEDGDTPLHTVLIGDVLQYEQDADLIKWMCEANPSSLLKTHNYGMTPLLRACVTTCCQTFDDADNILKVLIKACPESIRRPSRQGYLPIYYLLDDGTYYPEVITTMLKEYPESLDIYLNARSRRSQTIMKEFIQRIKPYVDDLRELKDNNFHLQVTTMFLGKAVACTKDELARSVSEVFDSWATDFVNGLKPKVEEVSTQLLQTCLEQSSSSEDSSIALCVSSRW